MERYMHKEIEKGFQEVGEPNLINTEVATLQIKRLRTIAKAYNKRTGSNTMTKNKKTRFFLKNKHTKTFEENCNETTKAGMPNIIVAQNKSMSSQALRTEIIN